MRGKERVSSDSHGEAIWRVKKIPLFSLIEQADGEGATLHLAEFDQGQMWLQYVAIPYCSTI